MPQDRLGHAVIIGAGHAGGSLAALLRQQGWAGPITLIGDEPRPPYQRPPLSKAWLKEAGEVGALLLKPDAFYRDKDITLLTGRRAIGLVPRNRRIRLQDGTELSYDKLVLATGARPRVLAVEGAGLHGVHVLRRLEDADALRTELQPGRTLAIVGAGYVGLEVAASARALGAAAVVIEREARPLARVACPELSDFFLETHRRQGVSFELGASVAAIEALPQERRAGGVRLAGGRLIACDAVLVGVGAEPDVELAAAAGLVCRNGIVVDELARTSDSDIYAIGDCTFRPLPLYGQSMRLESVPSALEQAKQAAAALCGAPMPPPEVPWFWSDQYEIKLQIAGIPMGSAERVVRKCGKEASFAVFHLDAGRRVRAVEAVNAVAEFMLGRQWIAAGGTVDPDKLSNGAVPLRECAS